MTSVDDRIAGAEDDETLLVAGSPGPASDLGDAFLGGEVLAGRWEILGILGVGGMGTVYRARDRELDEIVALKMIRRETFAPGMLERFRREVKLARRVSHRNVARVHELGEHRGERFFTMELIEGESLRSLLDRDGALPLARVVELGAAIARGLGAAHDADVVHRDLKPDNVLLGLDGRIALTDFGIAASLERTGAADTSSFAGTAMYMAPEQVDGLSPITARSDLYALGALLFEMATGEPPFDGATQLATAVARLTRPPPDPRERRPSLPREFADLVLGCLARQPGERVASAAVVEVALSSLAASGAHAPPISIQPAAMVASPAETTTASYSPWSARAAPSARIAVIPLLNLGNEEDGYIADGLTDDLVDALSSLRTLRVVSRSMTERYAGRRDLDPRALGADLRASVIASGTVRRQPDRTLQVALRLVSTSDGIQVWSKRFDVNDGNLLAINMEAAHAIARALAIDGPKRAQHLTDPAAVELYLRARARYREFSPSGAKTAAALLDQALAIAPGDPVLLAGKAMSLARMSFFRESLIQQAEETALRAIASAPDSGEAHLALGTVHLQRGDVQGAMRESLAAITLAPSLGEAHQLVARVLAETGPADAALRAFALAIEIEPRVGLTQLGRAQVFSNTGRLEEAVAIVEEARATMRHHPSLYIADARVALWRGDRPALAAAAAEVARLGALYGGTQGEIAARFGALLNPTTAPALIANPDTVPGEPRFPLRLDLFFLQMQTEVALFNGDPARAGEFLELAVARGLTDLLWLDGCPLLAPLRESQAWSTVRAAVLARAEPVWALLPRTTR